jgi:hypothetical protein
MDSPTLVISAVLALLIYVATHRPQQQITVVIEREHTPEPARGGWCGPIVGAVLVLWFLSAIGVF